MQPLALVAYQKLMPGSQLANRLQDLQYRVHVVNDLDQLLRVARTEKPMVILADFTFGEVDVCTTVTALKQHPITSHLPVVVFVPDALQPQEALARAAGAKVVCSHSALQVHLPQLLEQALQLE